MIPQQTTAYIPTWATQRTPAPQMMGATPFGSTAQPIPNGTPQQPNNPNNPLKGALASNVTDNIMTNSGASGQLAGLAKGVGGALGCLWIITYGNGGYMPWFIKPLRNIAYEREPEVQRGYEWMANWLVPLMMLSSTIDGLVRDLIVEPLTEHCAYINSIRGAKARTNYQRFWFGVWRLIGRRVK